MKRKIDWDQRLRQLHERQRGYESSLKAKRKKQPVRQQQTKQSSWDDVQSAIQSSALGAVGLGAAGALMGRYTGGRAGVRNLMRNRWKARAKATSNEGRSLLDYFSKLTGGSPNETHRPWFRRYVSMSSSGRDTRAALEQYVNQAKNDGMKTLGTTGAAYGGLLGGIASPITKRVSDSTSGTKTSSDKSAFFLPGAVLGSAYGLGRASSDSKLHGMARGGIKGGITGLGATGGVNLADRIYSGNDTTTRLLALLGGGVAGGYAANKLSDPLVSKLMGEERDRGKYGPTYKQANIIGNAHRFLRGMYSKPLRTLATQIPHRGIRRTVGNILPGTLATGTMLSPLSITAYQMMSPGSNAKDWTKAHHVITKPPTVEDMKGGVRSLINRSISKAKAIAGIDRLNQA